MSKIVRRISILLILFLNINAGLMIGLGGFPPLIDSDGDGLYDIDEEAYGTNPYDKDTDNDGWGDYAEKIKYGTNPTSRFSKPRVRNWVLTLYLYTAKLARYPKLEPMGEKIAAKIQEKRVEPCYAVHRTYLDFPNKQSILDEIELRCRDGWYKNNLQALIIYTHATAYEFQVCYDKGRSDDQWSRNRPEGDIDFDGVDNNDGEKDWPVSTPYYDELRDTLTAADIRGLFADPYVNADGCIVHAVGCNTIFYDSTGKYYTDECPNPIETQPMTDPSLSMMNAWVNHGGASVYLGTKDFSQDSYDTYLEITWGSLSGGTSGLLYGSSVSNRISKLNYYVQIGTLITPWGSHGDSSYILY